MAATRFSSIGLSSTSRGMGDVALRILAGRCLRSMSETSCLLMGVESTFFLCILFILTRKCSDSMSATRFLSIFFGSSVVRDMALHSLAERWLVSMFATWLLLISLVSTHLADFAFCIFTRCSESISANRFLSTVLQTDAVSSRSFAFCFFARRLFVRPSAPKSVLKRICSESIFATFSLSQSHCTELDAADPAAAGTWLGERASFAKT
mmetsp:Transcript_19249/g.39279  ORF Transcript_19249/g.39279 Transcript_19249/m.39279 type:complete len:209 (-) Transcript_19249:455-1081(-)